MKGPCTRCDGTGKRYRFADRDPIEGYKMADKKPCPDCDATGEVDVVPVSPNAIPKPTVVVETTTVRRSDMALNGAQLKELLGVPANARIKVSVPGGGDWSNTDLNLDEGHTLDISWEEHS